MTTYISKADADLIIHLSGEEIRAFLKNAPALDLNDEATQAIEDFTKNPSKYSDQELVLKGNDVAHAIHEPVRIEIRNLTGQAVAQVVAKGIWGESRFKAIENIRRVFKAQHKALRVRLAGTSSFEFNADGVDKSMPIRFAKANWSSILTQMCYTPGPFIDSVKTQTIVAADGDSTVYDGPKPGQPLPTVGMSPIKDVLVAYLRAGGVFMLISGNDLSRSVARMKDGIPQELFNRILIAANGGSDLVCLNPQGEPVKIIGYIDQKPGQVPLALDMVYIGDDGSPNGNDWPAFQEAGFNCSVLVAKNFEIDYDTRLRTSYVGGLILGTKEFLQKTTDRARQKPFQLLFNNAASHGGK